MNVNENAQAEVLKVRRYENRKLYLEGGPVGTTRYGGRRPAYVNLDYLENEVKSGRLLVVTHYPTMRDQTAFILKAIAKRQQKRKLDSLDSQELFRIVQQGA